MTHPSPEFLDLQAALAGEYSLQRELGRGGMGVVYLARDVQLDRDVAIKVLPAHLALDPGAREILELRDEQLSWTAIGERVGCEEEAARKRHGSAVRELTRLVVAVKAGRLREVLPE